MISSKPFTTGSSLTLAKMEGNLLRLVFHIITFSIYAYTVAYSTVYIMLPMHKQYGGRFKFLTYWNKVIHIIAHSVDLFCEW
jgi:hypothetical protein